MAFDCIYKGGQEPVWEPLMERKQILSQLVREDSKIAVSRYVETEGRAVYHAADEEFIAAGYKIPFPVNAGRKRGRCMGETRACLCGGIYAKYAECAVPARFKGYRDDVFPEDVQIES